MEIKLKDSSTFKIYADGSKDEIKSFFEDAIKIWNIEKEKTNN